MSRVVYIYALCEPGQPWNIRYVGKTTQPIRVRLNQHITEARLLKGISYKAHWIKALLSSGLRPTVKLIDIGDEETWEGLEVFYIRSYRKAGFRLVNLTSGGDHPYGHKCSLEFREKRRVYMLGNTLTLGLKLSEEHKRKISIAGRGRIVSQETRDKIGLVHRGKTITQEQKDRLSFVNKGKKASQETRNKMSEARKGERNGMFGKMHSEETKDKISATKRLRKRRESGAPGD